MDKILKVLTWQSFLYLLIGWVLGGLAGVYGIDYKFIGFGIILLAVAYFIIDKIVYSISKK